MFKNEVLPAPLGPMIEAIAPRLTAIDTSSTARTPPNRFDTAVAASNTSSDVSAARVVAPSAMLLAFLSPQPVFMQRRYGRHDAGADKRMQPPAWRTGHSGGRCRRPHGTCRQPRHRETIMAAR